MTTRKPTTEPTGILDTPSNYCLVGHMVSFHDEAGLLHAGTVTSVSPSGIVEVDVWQAAYSHTIRYQCSHRSKPLDPEGGDTASWEVEPNPFDAVDLAPRMTLEARTGRNRTWQTVANLDTLPAYAQAMCTQEQYPDHYRITDNTEPEHKPMDNDLKIEHSGNSVYAIHTADGPAVYPTLDDLMEAVHNDTIEVHDGDQEYYESRQWLPVKD